MTLVQLRRLTTGACAICAASALVASCAAPKQESTSEAAVTAPAPSPTPAFASPTSVAPSPTTTPSPSAAATTPAAPSSAPHFDTPDAAMRYLVEAYNTNNETDIRHVTSPDSRAQFEAERQWVKTFRFNECKSNGGPAWDYTCVLDIVELTPSAQSAAQPNDAKTMGEVTVLVAPAARPGYYLEANQGCGGG